MGAEILNLPNLEGTELTTPPKMLKRALLVYAFRFGDTVKALLLSIMLNKKLTQVRAGHSKFCLYQAHSRILSQTKENTIF